MSDAVVEQFMRDDPEHPLDTYMRGFKSGIEEAHRTICQPCQDTCRCDHFQPTSATAAWTIEPGDLPELELDDWHAHRLNSGATRPAAAQATRGFPPCQPACDQCELVTATLDNWLNGKPAR